MMTMTTAILMMVATEMWMMLIDALQSKLKFSGKASVRKIIISIYLIIIIITTIILIIMIMK